MAVDLGTDVIRRARSGERQALVRLVEAYQGPVYSLALAIMRDRADAADMTQETFVRVLRSINTYRGDGATFSGWVHRLTVNVCLDTLRRRQRSPLTREEHADAPDHEPPSLDLWAQPEWRTEWGEAVRDLRAALAKLTRPQRLALTLHYLEDRPYEEVATTMGVPLNTVKSHILRGKERLAGLLDAYRPPRPALAPATA